MNIKSEDESEIAVGTIRECIRITTCKRSTGNEGDTYRSFLFWTLATANEQKPRPKTTSMLWSYRRERIKAVWDGKHWRELGDKINPK